MRSRTPDVQSTAVRQSAVEPVRPAVLIAIKNDHVRARFAYQLTASGFDVMTDVGRNSDDAHLPDVIVAEIVDVDRRGTRQMNASGNQQVRDIPVIAIVDDVRDVTRARREGCAAVCLTSCSAGALAAGIHAVLGGRDELG